MFFTPFTVFTFFVQTGCGKGFTGEGPIGLPKHRNVRGRECRQAAVTY